MNKNKKVQLIEQTFGIKLPEFKLHLSCRESGDSEDNKIPNSAKWKHVTGVFVLPPELETHLPKEGMNPEQANKQLQICSSLSRGYGNDAYQLYSQEIMMRFLFVAITNCIYLASRDYKNWNKPVKPNEEETFLKLIKKEMWILHEAFSKERSNRFVYEREMGHLFLRLLLENNAPLNKGTDMSGQKSNKGVDIHYNTVKELLMMGSDEAYSWAMSGDDWLYMSLSRMLGQKCYDLTEQLLSLESN
jgi:hypothetical protein